MHPADSRIISFMCITCHQLIHALDITMECKQPCKEGHSRNKRHEETMRKSTVLTTE